METLEACYTDPGDREGEGDREEDNHEEEVQGEQCVQEAPPALQDAPKAQEEELEKMHLDPESPEKPRPVFVSSTLNPEEKKAMLQLLRDYKDVFAWEYNEMPGLDTTLVVYNLAVDPRVKPVKQMARKFSPEVELQIKGEIEKLLEARFIKPIQHPTWLANIVPVRKKNGQIRCCVDFRDLNKACPKDDFPLPHIDNLIDATAGHERFSFMDGFSGYNQIRMAPEDAERTAFRTPFGNFHYTVMPFGLKNASATYQRAMTAIFHDMLHEFLEDYVDDLVVKSKRSYEHLEHLERVFKRCRTFKLKMNPLKCAFGVSSGNFLGFKVHRNEISAEEGKIWAIKELKTPGNVKELQGFLGKIAYI